jgi:hypothetical protein
MSTRLHVDDAIQPQRARLPAIGLQDRPLERFLTHALGVPIFNCLRPVGSRKLSNTVVEAVSAPTKGIVVRNPRLTP